jgi:hypothetical protein
MVMSATIVIILKMDERKSIQMIFQDSLKQESKAPQIHGGDDDFFNDFVGYLTCPTAR